MSGSANDKLMLIKGFTFDGDTGKTMSDLYHAAEELGLARDPQQIQTRSDKGRALVHDNLDYLLYDSFLLTNQ